jgi:lysophospholipase L1-like esterase
MPNLWLLNAVVRENTGVIAPNSRIRAAAFPLVISLVLELGLAPATGAPSQRKVAERHWVGSWAASPVPAGNNPAHFSNQTLRLIIHTSIGGSQVRVHLSNTYGASALSIGAVHVGIRKSASDIATGSDRSVTFSGHGSISIPQGALVVSDPVTLELPKLADVAVSIFLPEAVAASTVHAMALETSYVSPPGDFTAAERLPSESTTISSWPFLTGLSVLAPRNGRAVIAFGDSITDGAGSKTDANGRWPDVLAARLAAHPSTSSVAVMNEGISGNRLLHDAEPNLVIFGQSALARFDRDVAAQPGASAIIVLLGINDIGHPGAGSPPSEDVTAEDIIAALKQLIERAHEHGMAIFGCTLTPFEGTTFAGYFTPAKDVKRDTVNKWIREGRAFDGVIDFDKVVRDPAHPSKLLPAFDSGDHLHPSSAGLKVMGESIDLSMLQ